MQYVLQRRELGTRQCASDVRRPEQRGSKCALQSHAQETPPAAQPQPTLPGRGAQGGRSALGSEAHKLSDQAERLRTPPANFACEDAQALWSWSQQLRVSCTLTPFSDSDGGAVARGSRGLGPPLASQRRRESDIATQRLQAL